MARWVSSVCLCAAPALTAVDVWGYVARVDGGSMRPALNPTDERDDYVFLSRWAARRGVERGDVVSLIAPKDPDKTIIKRVVALPGDVVPTIGYERSYVRVPDGHCWVEGDHTGRTLDSNSFGPVSLGLVTAKATAVVWPPQRWRRLDRARPERRPPVHRVK